MSTKMVQIEVSKESYEMGEKINHFVKDIKKALDDGWQVGEDLPIVINATLLDLIPAIKSASSVAPNYRENKEAFVTALLLTSKDLAFDFIPKAEVVPT